MLDNMSNTTKKMVNAPAASVALSTDKGVAFNMILSAFMQNNQNADPSFIFGTHYFVATRPYVLLMEEMALRSGKHAYITEPNTLYEADVGDHGNYLYGVILEMNVPALSGNSGDFGHLVTLCPYFAIDECQFVSSNQDWDKRTGLWMAMEYEYIFPRGHCFDELVGRFTHDMDTELIAAAQNTQVFFAPLLFTCSEAKENAQPIGHLGCVEHYVKIKWHDLEDFTVDRGTSATGIPKKASTGVQLAESDISVRLWGLYGYTDKSSQAVLQEDSFEMAYPFHESHYETVSLASGATTSDVTRDWHMGVGQFTAMVQLTSYAMDSTTYYKDKRGTKDPGWMGNLSTDESITNMAVRINNSDVWSTQIPMVIYRTLYPIEMGLHPLKNNIYSCGFGKVRTYKHIFSCNNVNMGMFKKVNWLFNLKTLPVAGVLHLFVEFWNNAYWRKHMCQIPVQ
jgi:hypothetical protein